MAEQNPFSQLFTSSPAPTSVRLAVVKPGEQQDALKIDLITADPKDTTYDCLSYDRSNNVDSVQIEVAGEQLAIPAPLESALRNLRYNDKPRTLWADLLIGSTVEDRSAQADEMKTVFAHAETVIAWLGSKDEYHDTAFDTLRNFANRWHQARLHSNFPEYQNRATQQQMMAAHQFLISKPADDLKLSDSKLQKAIQDIFDSPYFQTTQSIPEIILAKKAVVTVANQSIPWEEFNAALTAYLMLAASNGVQFSASFMDSYQRISRLELATLRKRNGDSLELLAMLKDARRTSCPDPREVIFSLIPIITPCERTKGTPRQPSPPKADYSKSVNEVFTVACQYIIEERQDVMLWSFGERPPCTRRIPSLPSWVPDFSSPQPLDIVYTTSNTKSGLRAWADPLQNKKIYVDSNSALHVQAHALDRIISVSEPFTEQNCRRLCLTEWQKIPTLPGQSLADKIAKVWRSLCLNTGEGFNPTDLRQSAVPPQQMWMSFQSILAEERIMSLLGCTMEELLAQSPELIARAQTMPDVQTLVRETGKSQPFEQLLKKNAIGRRFFQTESGRVGMTAIEVEAPPAQSDDGTQPPMPNFDQALSEPLGQHMLTAFQAFLAERDPTMAAAVAQGINGTLPGQRAPGVRSGDLVVAIVGGFSPFVLRPVTSNDGDGGSSSGAVSLPADSKYTFVGDCYLHGVMDGECFKESSWFGLRTTFRQNIETADILIV